MKSYSNLDLNLNELKNIKIDVLSALPTAMTASRLVYVTSTNILYYCNGTKYVPLTEDTNDNTTYTFNAWSKTNNGKLVYKPSTASSTSTVIIYTPSGDVAFDSNMDTIIQANKVTYAKMQKTTGTNVVLGTDTSKNIKELDKTALLSLLGISTTTTVTDGSTALPDGNAVYDFVMEKIGDYSGALIYRGTLTKAADIPANHSKGDVYVVKTAFTLNGVEYEVGDMFICNTTRTEQNYADWDVVNTNWSVSNGNPTLSYSASSTVGTVGGKNLTIKALPTLIENKHYQPLTVDATQTAEATASDGEYITGISLDSKDHVLGITKAVAIIPKKNVLPTSSTYLTGTSGTINFTTSTYSSLGVNTILDCYAIADNEKCLLDITITSSTSLIWKSNTTLANTDKVQLVVLYI